MKLMLCVFVCLLAMAVAKRKLYNEASTETELTFSEEARTKTVPFEDEEESKLERAAIPAPAQAASSALTTATTPDGSAALTPTLGSSLSLNTTPIANAPSNKTRGACACAAFDTIRPEEGAKPLLVQTPINVSCNATGEDECLKLCTALALAAKDRGPATLCLHVGHANKTLVSVFSNTCSQPKYIYTGLTNKEPICCHDSKWIPCADEKLLHA